jgi:hypothetical protein
MDAPLSPAEQAAIERLRAAYADASRIDWPFSPGDVTVQSPRPRRHRRRQRGPWTQRVTFVVVVVSILAVFLVPLIHHLVIPAKSPAGTSVPTTPTKPLPIWRQVADLKASDAATLEYFGGGLTSQMETAPLEEAVSGTIAVVGEPFYANQNGRAYVFTRTASGWKQSAELEGSDTTAGDDFGSSVAISDTTIVVGAPYHGGETTGGVYAGPGRAYVFTKTATGWKQAAELRGPASDASEFFGASVAISGTIAVIGAPFQANRAGRAYVFTETATGWQQTAELKGSDTVVGDEFGYSVAIFGTTAVVCAWDHANQAGRAYVFARTASGWKQTAELKGSDTVAGDSFGASVALSGTVAIVGAPSHANQAGRAYVFAETASGWKQTAELKGSDTVAGDEFGFSLAVSGDTAVVGAPNHANAAGRAYVFQA